MSFNSNSYDLAQVHEVELSNGLQLPSAMYICLSAHKPTPKFFLIFFITNNSNT